MKTLITTSFMLLVLATSAQPILFKRCYGGPGNEERCFSTIDAPPGVIMSGRCNANGGDVSGFHGSNDGWVVRTDGAGNIAWSKCYGGGDDETIMRSICTTDNSIVHVGYSSAPGGDVTTNFGSTDFWVIKTDSSGNIIWQKSYGGSHEDCAYDVIDPGDGTYIVSGITHSNDSMVSNHYGAITTRDVWIIKISALDGHLIWEKSFGGTGNESIASNYRYFRLMGMIMYDASSFAFTIGTNSMDGDVVGGNGSAAEYWLVKADTAGNVLFQETYGGSSYDVAYDLVKAPDGGFAMIGASTSTDGDVTGHHGTTPGMYDYWIVKTDAGGVLQWQRSCGGGNYDDGFSVCATPLGFYITGRSESLDADVAASGWHGGSDYWIAYLDYNGILMWDRCFGGTGYEEGYDVLITSDGKLTCCGHAGSGDGDVTGQHGGFDFWLIKLADVTGIPQHADATSITVFPNPGSAVVNFPGVALGTMIDVYNTNGALVAQFVNENGTINCRDLPAGIYEFIMRDEDSLIGSVRWIKLSE